MLSSIYKKLRNTVVKLLIKVLTFFGHATNTPLLSALAWRLSLGEMKNISQRGIAEKKLIVLAKSGGVDDLEAAYNTSQASFKIYILPRIMVKRTFRYYLEGRVSDGQYLTANKETERLKLEYRAYLYSVLKHFQNLFGCDAILQFNFVYHAERELAAASSELGYTIPV